MSLKIKTIISIMLTIAIVITGISLPQNALQVRADGIRIILNNGLLTIEGNGSDILTYETLHFLTQGTEFQKAKTMNIKGVQKICDGVFSDFDCIKEINIGPGCAEIGNNAFGGCDNVEKVNLPNTVVTIGDGAFKNCCITEIAIPDSVTSIGAGAFMGNNLQKVEIGAGITSIGEFAFTGNENLSDIKINQPDPSKLNVSEGAFFDIKTDVTITVPEGTETEYKKKLEESGIAFGSGGGNIPGDPNPSLDPPPAIDPKPNPGKTDDPVEPENPEILPEIGPSADGQTYITADYEKAEYVEKFAVEDAYDNEISLKLYGIKQKDESIVYGLINVDAKSLDSLRAVNKKSPDSVKEAARKYFAKYKLDVLEKVALYYGGTRNVVPGPKDGKSYTTNIGEKADFVEYIPVTSGDGQEAQVALYVIEKDVAENSYGLIDSEKHVMVFLGSAYHGDMAGMKKSIARYFKTLKDKEFRTEVSRYYGSIGDIKVGPSADGKTFILDSGDRAVFITAFNVQDNTKKEITLKIFAVGSSSTKYKYGLIVEKDGYFDTLGMDDTGDLEAFKKVLLEYFIKMDSNAADKYYGTVKAIYVSMEVAGRKIDIKSLFPDYVTEQQVIYRIQGKTPADTKQMKKIASISKSGMLKGKKSGCVTVEACVNLGSKKKPVYNPIYSLSVPIIKPLFDKKRVVYAYTGEKIDAEEFLTKIDMDISSVSSNAMLIGNLEGGKIIRCIETAGYDTYWKCVENKMARIEKDGVITVGSKSGKFKYALVIKDRSGTEKSIIGYVNVKVPELKKKTVTLKQNRTYTLDVKNVKPENKGDIVWKSDDLSVATVSDEGIVTAVGSGEANIIGVISNMELKCTVKVP